MVTNPNAVLLPWLPRSCRLVVKVTQGNGRGGFREEEKKKEEEEELKKERGQPCAAACFPGLFRYSDMCTSQPASQPGRKEGGSRWREGRLGAVRPAAASAAAARHASMEEAIAPIALSASPQSSSLH